MKPGELIVGGVNVTEEYGLFIQDRPDFTPPQRKIISNTNRVNKIIDDYEDVTMTLELIGRVQHRKTTIQRNEVSLVREWQNELTSVFYKTVQNDPINSPYLDFIFYFDEAHKYYGVVENITYENKNWYDMYIQVEMDIRFKPYKYIKNNPVITLTTANTSFSPDPYNNGQVPYNYISEPTIYIQPGVNVSTERRVNIDNTAYIKYKQNEAAPYDEILIWNEIKYVTTFDTHFNGGGPAFYKRFERPYKMSKTNGIDVVTVQANWRTLI